MFQTLLPYFFWALIGGHTSAPPSHAPVQQTAPQITKDSFIHVRKLIKKHLQDYRISAQPEKCYIHTDRTLYEPGESVGFNAYLRDADNLKPSATSQVLYVKLIGPNGSCQIEQSVYVAEGTAAGEFVLDNNWPGGIYKIKAWTKWMMNTRDTFVKNITVQRTVLPRSNIQFEFEKKSYGPGDEVEAKIDLQGLYNEPLDFQKINFTVDTAGRQFIQGETQANAQGLAVIRFRLPENLSSVDALLNVQVMYRGQPEAISRSIPIVLNKINLAFFPEGGDAVAGLPCRMAFKAVNEYGKPADVQGFITNQQGERLAEFSSFHNGMGAFDFTPKENEKYTATITHPFLSKVPVKLPEIKKQGVNLHVQEITDKYLTVRILSTRKQTVYLSAIAQDSLVFYSKVNVSEEENKIKIPTESLPSGIVRLTLFNYLLEEQAERLVFVNRDKKLHIDITPDKDKYFPREKVNLNVHVTDHQGKPVEGRFSMAVVDETNLTFADDKQGHIQASLLLEQDVKGKIEDPNFYFDEKEPKSLQALDYLLMTQGWRRFDWKGSLANYVNPAEKAGFSGYVYNKKGQPCAYKEVRLMPGGPVTTTDLYGHFIFEGVDLQAYDFAQAGNVKISLNEKQDRFNTFYDNKIETISGVSTPTFLSGKVYDPNPNMGDLIGATIRVYKGTSLVRGGLTDVNGDFRISLPVGVYDILVSYTGYAPRRVNGLHVLSGELNKINIEMTSNAPLKEVEIKEYRVPLINPDDVMTYLRPDINPVKTTPAPKGKSSSSAAKPDKGKAVKTSLYNSSESGYFADVTPIFNETAVRHIKKPRKRKQTSDGYFIINLNPQYRGRVYYIPPYLPTDTSYYYPTTLYWNPTIVTDKAGNATVSFHTSDAATCFHITMEGAGKEGLVGHAHKQFYTEKALNLDAKIPPFAVVGDTLLLQAAITNSSDKPLSGDFSANVSGGLLCLESANASLTIMPGETKIVPVPVLAKSTVKNARSGISMHFSGSDGHKEKFTSDLTLYDKGFPVHKVSGNGGLSSEYQLDLTNVVPHSASIKLNVYPSLRSDLFNNLERMIQQPNGCFEQTTSSVYPNLMAFDLMKHAGQLDIQTENKVKQNLVLGYKLMAKYECKTGGFDWHAQPPGNEALTAYGVLVFTELKKIIEVDQAIIDRSVAWLKTRTDGKGGWQGGRATRDMEASESLGAYIAWAMSEAGYAQQIMPEINAAYNNAILSGDMYQIALMANTMLNLKDPRSVRLVEILESNRKDNGSWRGLTKSVFNSENYNFTVETTSLAVLALLKAGKKVDKSINFIAENKNAYGFGSTQSTMLALKALVSFANKDMKPLTSGGSFSVYVDDREVVRKFFRQGTPDKITFDGLEQYFTNTKPVIKVLFNNENRTVPYDLEKSYTSYWPEVANDCNFTFETKLLKNEAKAGETIRMTAAIANLTKGDLASPMMILAIPAGLSIQPWQIKQLSDEKQFDYCEIKENCVVFYFRKLTASETRTINLDLRADIPGTYDSPASQAYLYYSNNQRVWSRAGRVTVSSFKDSGF